MNPLLAFVFVAIGGVLVALAFYVRDELISRQWMKEAEDAVFNSESWCNKNCKLCEECNSRHKDPDDALDELINTYCVDCPISIAGDIIAEAERKGKK